MAFFDDLKNKVSKTARDVAQKSSEVYEINKLKWSLGQEKDKVKAIYTEIGETVYNASKDNSTYDLNEKFDAIKAIEEQIKSLEQKIMELKNSTKCKNCGTEVENNVAFCPKCGAKIEVNETVVEETEQKEETENQDNN